MSPRSIFFVSSAAAVASIGAACVVWAPAAWMFVVVAPVIALGIADLRQSTHAIRRNFPVIGRLRYLFEAIRPEINQYFVESDLSGTPFSREMRSVAYQRAKHTLDTVAFGTQQDVYAPGYEWMEHSMLATASAAPVRVRIGGSQCSQPYDAALLNVSAMSFGSLSRAAIEALNRGAAAGGFFHNTGEGGISAHHRHGGDLVWQIGTGYFGCRTDEGTFCAEHFVDNARLEAVKMIEIKLSQGAKPGHGGILPAAKLTPEIAQIRGVPLGRDVLSPPAHSAFSTPRELVRFVARLRDLSGGKPVGIKLCLGRRHEFLAICRAMIEEDSTVDFVTVDGGEGGTGAAPLEFSNRLGTPMADALSFVHNALVGAGLRDRVRVIASGRIVTGFDMARAIALGADLCNSARAMMFALGCIQARRCNSNECPAGVATQDPSLVVGLVASDKAVRVANYQRQTVHALCELLGAAGLQRPEQLRPSHIYRRIDAARVEHFGTLFPRLAPGALLDGPAPRGFEAWAQVSADSFSPEIEPVVARTAA